MVILTVLGRHFKWLEDTLEKHFKNIHKTNHMVQSEFASTYGLHTIYFIGCMMNPLDRTAVAANIDVGLYVHKHYDKKSENAN